MLGAPAKYISHLRVHEKIKSHFIHPGFRPSSPYPVAAKSSKELAIPPVLPSGSNKFGPNASA
jgi:hypothetical protein